ncbi:MAG: hypothetical protein MGU50_18330 [Trichodesmium sp. MAG_R02]|nr:hypothetical protein [Trichodesmium sp. MAG_R02]
MHATSLQGFDYRDVVHQFEKRCKAYPMAYLSKSLSGRAFLWMRVVLKHF